MEFTGIIGDTYFPKHLKVSSKRSGHCCFSGCTPMRCGCCTYGMGHEPNCPDNPLYRLELRAEELYKPKHMLVE